MNVQPIKTIRVRFTSVAIAAVWGVNDGSGDPFVNNPYQWTVHLTVTPQPHSSFSTQTPYVYDGLDINVGDWISNASGGFAWKIISKSSVTAGSLIVIIEDEERYNTFADASQQGVGDPANFIEGFVFSINNDGLPLIAPVIENVLSSTWQVDLISRFVFRNFKLSRISVNQISHGFSVGDIIGIVSGNFDTSAVYAKSASGIPPVGQVIEVVPGGGDYFTFIPFGKVVYNTTTLPGFAGDFIYTSTTTNGALTETNTGGYPVYIKIDDTTGILLDGTIFNKSKTIAFFASGKPTASLVLSIVMTEGGIISADLGGTQLYAGTNPASSTTINVAIYNKQANTTSSLGNITVAIDGSITLPTVSAQTLSAGDAIKITFAASRDANFSDIALSFKFYPNGT